MPSFRSPSRLSFINLIPFIFLLFHHSSSDSYLLFNSSLSLHICPRFSLLPPSARLIMFPCRSWFLCDSPTSASFLPFFASCRLYYISHSFSQQLASPSLSLFCLLPDPPSPPLLPPLPGEDWLANLAVYPQCLVVPRRRGQRRDNQETDERFENRAEWANVKTERGERMDQFLCVSVKKLQAASSVW